MGRYSPEYLTKREGGNIKFNFIRQAIRHASILEAQVDSCDSDGTLTLNLGDKVIGKIFIDDLEYNIDNKETKIVSASSKVGKHIKFVPLQIIDKQDGKYIIKCSRRESQRVCFEKYIKKLMPGDIIDAKVLKVVSYGIFCDIGCGIVALLPTNHISVTHIINPEHTLKHINRLKVVVKEIDENYRIQLSHRELLGTWEEEVSKFKEDDIVHGTVISKEEYGTFIRLSQNLSGLAENPEFELNEGDTVVVKITNIKPVNMKVKLIILEKLVDDNGDNIEEKIKFKYNISYGHINNWVYSTPTAKRQIHTVFNEYNSDNSIEINN